MKRTLLVVVLVLCGQARADDAVKPISLAEVLAAAVRQAPELERASMDLEAARGTLQRAEGIEDIRVSATYNFIRFSLPMDQEDMTTGYVDVSRALPTGGMFHVTASGTKVEAGTTFGGVVYPPGVTTGLQFALVQPLLRNFGLGVARAPRYEAEHRADAAALDRELRARDLVRAIVDAYWRVALAHAQLDIRKAALATAEQQAKFTESAIKIGKLPRSELLAVEQAIAVRKQDILAAELDVTERSLALRRIAGLEIGPDAIEVATAVLPAVKPEQIDAHDSIARALAHSPAIAQAMAAQDAEDARTTAADSQLLPQLDLGLSAGPLGTGTNFSSSFDSLKSSAGYQAGVSLTASYALGRNDEHGGARQAHARLYKAKVDARDAKAAVAADAARTVQAAKAAATSIELGDKAVELATENVEAEIHRFEDRKSTNFDVLRRQDELQAAKLRRATAIVDYLSARARLGALTGTILGEYGIRLPE